MRSAEMPMSGRFLISVRGLSSAPPKVAIETSHPSWATVKALSVSLQACGGTSVMRMCASCALPRRQRTDRYAQVVRPEQDCEHTLPERQVQIADREEPPCLLYTSDAADERSSVDLGGRRI